MYLQEIICKNKWSLSSCTINLLVWPRRTFFCFKNKKFQSEDQKGERLKYPNEGSQKRPWLDKFVINKKKQNQYTKELLQRGLNPRTNAFRIRVLKSGAFDGPRSVVLESNHKSYLFNCGEGTQRALNDCSISLLKIEDILITHTSWENIGGLYGMLITRLGILMNQPEGWGTAQYPLLDYVAKIHGPPQVAKVLEIAKLADSSDLWANTQKLNISGGSYSNFQLDIEYVKIKKTACLQTNGTSAKEYIEASMDTEGSQEKNQLLTEFAVAYIIRPKPVWTTDISKLIALDIKERGLWEWEVLEGRPYTLDDGRVITREDISLPPDLVPPVVVLECPSEEYLESMISSEKLIELSNHEDFKPQLMIHMSPADIVDREEYQIILDRFKTTDHLLVNKQSKHSVVSKSVAFHQCLNNLHPGIFKDLPSYRTHAERTKPSSEQVIQGEGNLKYYLRPYRRHRPGFDWDGCFMINREQAVQESYEHGSKDVVKTVAAWKEYLRNLPEPTDRRKYPEVVFLGTGSSFPTLRRAVSAILLHLSPEKCMLLDCGEDTMEQIRTFYGDEADDVLRKLEGIFISHDHTDHHLGLCGVISARHNALLSRGLPITKLLILGTPMVKKWLYHQLAIVMPGFHELDYIQHTTSNTYKNRYILEKLGLGKLQLVTTDHIRDSRGICLTHSSGWQLVYSGDTLPCKELVKKGMRCDLLIHEATFSDELKHEAQAKKHCTMSEAIKIGREMGAKFTILTHFSQRYRTVPIFPKIMYRNVAVAFDLMKVTLDDLPVLCRLKPVLESVFEQYISQTKIVDNKAANMTEIQALNKVLANQGKSQSELITRSQKRKFENERRHDIKARKEDVENLKVGKRNRRDNNDTEDSIGPNVGEETENQHKLKRKHVKKRDNKRQEFEIYDYSVLENIIENDLYIDDETDALGELDNEDSAVPMKTDSVLNAESKDTRIKETNTFWWEKVKT